MVNVLNFQHASDINDDSFAHISFLTTTEEETKGQRKPIAISLNLYTI